MRHLAMVSAPMADAAMPDAVPIDVRIVNTEGTL
jgi:hypothetical protein